MFRWLFILFLTLGLGAEELRIQVLCTADLHGWVASTDCFTLHPVPQGWAKVATLIRGLKASNPNTLLVDCGDALTGDPMDYVRQATRPDLAEPNVAIMNSLGYHAMAVGNQDFMFGFPYLRSMEEQAQFPFLAANLVLPDGKPAFTPYAKVEFGGVSVAVLGLATTLPSQLGDFPSLGDVRVADPLATARALVPRLRQNEKVDLVILALHGALPLKEAIPGVDLILMAHGNQSQVGGIPVIHPRSYGREVGVADCILHKDWGRWKVRSLTTRLVPVGAETQDDPQVMELTAPLRVATDAYLNTFATQLEVDLDGRWARMEDGPLLQLLHTTMRSATRAQITAVPSPSPSLFIPRGATSVRQFYAILPTEQRVARIRITGAQLRAYLEHAARYYNFSHLPELINKAVLPSDFDVLDGVNYALDISRPLGNRVVTLNYQGQPVKDSQEFTLAVSERRLNGKGGYMEAIAFRGQAEWVSEASWRNLLLAHVLGRPALNPVPTRQWRIVPALDRERVMAQER
ncbi:bifunctional metallophosphatase/5'-nucleotidase [Holophaga foetida]|uniref:bifunctional metallophosphatase/5'-nucleotidase n=1 Tax=Holophaga foetida TaxID=35839 RepID=UPI0002472AC6|nr:bifunctional UDP-sugar hydrolase/5'-nucleotidase [Holophaga foetida]